MGKRIVKRETPNGTYFNELIVSVFCAMCGASFIGPSREAGGFLGGHEAATLGNLAKRWDAATA